MRSAAPEKENEISSEKQALYPAERLRIVYQLITNPVEEGGAGITPGHGHWENVEAVFALHDHDFNKKWLKKWATQYTLKIEDLDDIRDRFGEKVRNFRPANIVMKLIKAGCILLRLYPVLLHQPDRRRSLWRLGLFSPRILLSNLRRCE